MSEHDAAFTVSEGGVHAPDGQQLARFDLPIRKAIAVDDVIVVLLDVPKGVTLNENIFGVACAGGVIWQIARAQHVYDDSPYTDLLLRDGAAVASNWDGDMVAINISDGSVTKMSYTK
jgi:hypothetical protein